MNTFSAKGKSISRLERQNAPNPEVGHAMHKTGEVELDTRVLSKGENILKIEITGADKFAKPGNMAGIDFLKFEKLN